MANSNLHDDFKILSKAVYGNNLGKTINVGECVIPKSEKRLYLYNSIYY